MRKMSVGLNTNISYENQFYDIKLTQEEREELYLILLYIGGKVNVNSSIRYIGE